MARSRPSGLALMTLVLVASCAGSPSGSDGSAPVNAAGASGASGSTPNGASASPSFDPLWGTPVMVSPSPGDTNPLHIQMDGDQLVYTVDPTSALVMTYTTRRTTGNPSPGPDQDLTVVESLSTDNHFEVRMTYKRFYHGDYTVNAYPDQSTTPIGTRTFQMQ